MSRPDGGAARLSPAEQLSFVAARAIAAGQAYLHTRDQQALAGEVATITAMVAQLPDEVQALPLMAFLGAYVQALALVPLVGIDRKEFIALAILAYERLLRSAHRDQRDAPQLIAGAS